MAKTALIFFGYWFPNWIRIAFWQNFNKVKGPGHDSQLAGTPPNHYEWCSFIQHTPIEDPLWAWLCGLPTDERSTVSLALWLLALPTQLPRWLSGYRVSRQERQHEFWSLFQSALTSASEEKSLWELVRRDEMAGDRAGGWGSPLLVPGNHVYLQGDRSGLYGKLLAQPQRPCSCPVNPELSRGEIRLWYWQIPSEFAACGEICLTRFWEILGRLVGLSWKFSQQIFI